MGYQNNGSPLRSARINSLQTYVISYDMAWGGDYDTLYEAIKSYGAWAHIAESTWAVLIEYSAEVIRDHLSEYLPDGSRLFVVRSGDEAAGQYLNCASDEWLEAILSQDAIRLNKLHAILQPDS